MGNSIQQGPPSGFDFIRDFRVVSAIRRGKEAHLENCGKIILPPSALQFLGRCDIEWPILFRVCSIAEDGRTPLRSTHCGVLEFSSGEGEAILPSWMMTTLAVQDDSYVRVSYVTLPLGNFVRLQPHHFHSFQKLENPKIILERGLRNYSALTVGQVVSIPFGETAHRFNVLAVQPENPSNAISIIETDLDLDLAPAVDAPAENDLPVDSSAATADFLSALDSSGTLTPIIEKGSTTTSSIVPFSGAGRQIGKPGVVTSSNSTPVDSGRSILTSSSSSSSSSSSLSSYSQLRTSGSSSLSSSSLSAKSTSPNLSPSSTTTTEPLVPFSGAAFRIGRGRLDPSETPSTSLSTSSTSPTIGSPSRTTSTFSSSPSSSSSSSSSSYPSSPSVSTSPISSSSVPQPKEQGYFTGEGRRVRPRLAQN